MTQRLLGVNEGRTDDNIETIKKRFKTFTDSSMPVVATWRPGKVASIDAGPEEVYAKVEHLLREIGRAPRLERGRRKVIHENTR